jgi:hypothetical protein
MRKFIPVESISIDIDITKDIAALPAKPGKGWKEACKTLAKAFHEGGSVWESSPSSSTTCAISGKESTRLGTKIDASLSVNLKITKDGDAIRFSLEQAAAGKTRAKVFRSITIPVTEWSAEFLADDEFASTLAFALVDSLPAAAYLDRSRLTSSTGILSAAEFKGQRFTKKFDSITPNASITFYRMTMDADTGRFFAEHLGEAKLTGKDKTRFQSGTGSSTRTAFIDTARYKLDAKARTATTAGNARIWSHNSDGAGQRSVELEKAVSSAHERLSSAARSGLLSNLFTKGYDSISNLLFQTAASGYVGLRYGKQLLKGDDLVENGSLYGLLVEVRSGPLSGIKFYYDKFPQQTATANGTTTTLEWTRFVLGRSFSFKFPLFINRVEVTPKLGRYYLLSRQPVERDADGNVTATQDFQIRNQPSVSLEVSAERAARLYTARVWYAIDRGIPFLPVLGTSAVSSERAGLDLFLNSTMDFRLFGVDYTFNVLTFGMYENIAIENIKMGDLDPGEVAVSGVELRAAYAGLGLVLNW